MDTVTSPHALNPLPPAYPSDWIDQVELVNGLKVTIRPILPEDASQLQEGYRRLSAQSRYLRFLQSAPEISPQLAQEFSNLDYHTRMALVAEIESGEEQRLIGVARYGMLGPEYPDSAECGIVVGDDYQQQGLGTMLMERLARYAYLHGIKQFLGTVHITNATMLRFVKRAGLPYERTIIEPGIWEVRVQLGG